MNNIVRFSKQMYIISNVIQKYYYPFLNRRTLKSRKILKVIKMTRLGEYLAKKSANKAAVGKRAGISRSRMSELANNDSTRLTARELHLIALAVDDTPCELLTFLYGDVLLPSSESGEA